MDLGHDVRGETVRSVERDGVAFLAATDDALSRHAAHVHDTRDGRAVNAASRGGTEGDHASAAYERIDIV